MIQSKTYISVLNIPQWTETDHRQRVQYAQGQQRHGRGRIKLSNTSAHGMDGNEKKVSPCGPEDTVVFPKRRLGAQNGKNNPLERRKYGKHKHTLHLWRDSQRDRTTIKGEEELC